MIRQEKKGAIVEFVKNCSVNKLVIKVLVEMKKPEKLMK